MVEIGLGFIKRCERIILRSGAVAESCDLRKNEPHPVALFLPTADLGECCVIGLGLRFDKAVEVVGLIHGLHGYQSNVSCSISSRDRLDFCSERSVSVDVSRRCRLLPGGWWFAGPEVVGGAITRFQRRPQDDRTDRDGRRARRDATSG